LTAEEGARQKEVTLQLMANPPATITGLIAGFIQKIEAHAEN
jgi:hypothetical protein